MFATDLIYVTNSKFRMHPEDAPPPYSAATYPLAPKAEKEYNEEPKACTKAEMKRVKALKLFLQHCYAEDYLIPTSIKSSTATKDDLGDSAFKLARRGGKERHWDELRKLLVAPLQPRQPGTREPSLDEQAENERRLVEHVDRPAEIIGLNKARVRRRLQYGERYEINGHEIVESSSWSKSEVIELARRRMMADLAEKLVSDREVYLHILFDGVTVKERGTGNKLSLDEVLQASLKEIQNRFFTRLETPTDYMLSPAAAMSFGMRKFKHELQMSQKLMERYEPCHSKVRVKMKCGGYRVVARYRDILWRDLML